MASAGSGRHGVGPDQEVPGEPGFRAALPASVSHLDLDPDPRHSHRSDAGILNAIAKANGFTLVNGAVTGIDAATNSVQTSAGTISYDYLVIAMGSGKLKPPGVENSESLCTGPQAAVTLREQLDALLAAGTGRIAVGFGSNPKIRRRYVADPLSSSCSMSTICCAARACGSPSS